VNTTDGTFLDSDTVIDLLSTSETSDTNIPRGKKENLYFIINNEQNHNRVEQGKKRKYVDDCGVWKYASIKAHYFVHTDNQFRYVDLSKGVYTTTVSNNRVQMNPQPDPSTVVIVKRSYNSLKRQNDYKRRITWIESAPSTLKIKQTPCYSGIHRYFSRRDMHSWQLKII